MGRASPDRGTGLGCICAYARDADDDSISALNWDTEWLFWLATIHTDIQILESRGFDSLEILNAKCSCNAPNSPVTS